MKGVYGKVVEAFKAIPIRERGRTCRMPIRKLMDKAKEWLGFARSVKSPPEAYAKFLLTYDDLLIGTLRVEHGLWKFEYSDKFRSEENFRPIVEFPDVNKTYVNEELWQFFASRIPSTKQP